MKKITYRLGELFCGAGGLALGAKSAHILNHEFDCSISHVWATDYDMSACETYRRNICPDNPESVICCDIRQLSFEKLQSISPIDGLAFGFPCNDFSIVGEQQGINGTYGPLYKYGVTALNFFNPQWFLAENVSGLKNSNDGRAFDIILEELRNAGDGYEITPHLYKFECYGIPQARHRIIIVGIRKDLDKIFRVPSPEPYKNVDVSCRKAIENPPIPRFAYNHEFTKQSQVVIERLKYIKPGENAFTAKIPTQLQLNVRGAKISQIYKRLDPTKPAYTITGSGGGGTHVYHWSENRSLTNRERARLQTFPDNFIFYGSKESVRKQIGMAVPPRAAEIVFNALLSSLLDIQYPFIPSNIIAVKSLFEGTHYTFNESNGEYQV
ncbi:DNA cytosine methyltransferase [Synechococcus sp. C9]|jgi:DNA (cytosine-5)-methyltransferase 1|uniref:DNA cytosine methyltransferase n=1 Tax=Synechococcus sp. C9 TaxID=102119 RepID=UPI001FF0E64C|nr:DNA cytosine methyltransferase [Synechococcus sp. C9]